MGGKLDREWSDKTKINLYLGDCLPTRSQPAVHSDSLTVDEAEDPDHEPLAVGDHAEIQPGNLAIAKINLYLLISFNRLLAFGSRHPLVPRIL